MSLRKWGGGGGRGGGGGLTRGTRLCAKNAGGAYARNKTLC